LKLRNGEQMKKVFDGIKEGKLGSESNPAVVRVKTKKRMKEVEAVFNENGWQYVVELEPDKSEDITALEILLNPIKTRIAEEKVGRNDPCPCGSGKKFKKCCGK